MPRLLSDNKILFEWCCPPVARVYSTCVQFPGQPTPFRSVFTRSRTIPVAPRRRVAVRHARRYQTSVALDGLRLAQRWGRLSGARSTVAGGRRPCNGQTFVDTREIRVQSSFEDVQGCQGLVASAKAQSGVHEATTRAETGSPSPQPGPRFTPPCPQPGLKSAHFQRMRKTHKRLRKTQPCATLCYHVARAPGDAEAVSNAVDLPDPDPLAVLARPRAVAKTRRAGLYRAKFASAKPAGTTTASRALYSS